MSKIHHKHTHVCRDEFLINTTPRISPHTRLHTQDNTQSLTTNPSSLPPSFFHLLFPLHLFSQLPKLFSFSAHMLCSIPFYPSFLIFFLLLPPSFISFLHLSIFSFTLQFPPLFLPMNFSLSTLLDSCFLCHIFFLTLVIFFFLSILPFHSDFFPRSQFLFFPLIPFFRPSVRLISFFPLVFPLIFFSLFSPSLSFLLTFFLLLSLSSLFLSSFSFFFNLHLRL